MLIKQLLNMAGERVGKSVSLGGSGSNLDQAIDICSFILIIIYKKTFENISKYSLPNNLSSQGYATK